MRLCKQLFLSALLLTALQARAQLNRSAVSVKGSDTNPCTPALPCRSLATALSQTNPGGELIALDSGGYGSLTIDRSVSLIAPRGVYAGITPAPFTDGITISLASPGKVVIRGWTLDGHGFATNGIVFSAGGGKLHVENCVINAFLYNGILTYFDTVITDTVIRSGGSSSNSQGAIVVDNGGAPVSAVIQNVQMIDNNDNLFVFRNALVTARDVIAVDSRNYGFGVAAGSTLNLDRCLASRSNLVGIHVAGVGAMLRVSNCTSTDNSVGMRPNYTGTLETWQNNKVRGNASSNVDNGGPFPPGTIVNVTQN